MILGNEGGFVWIPMAIGAAMGAIKNQGDKKKADDLNKAASVQTMYSPHTGMGRGNLTQAPSGLEAMMQGAAAGAQMGGMMGGGAGAAGGATSAAGGTGGMSGMSAMSAPSGSLPVSSDVANSYVANNASRNTMGNDWFMGMDRQKDYFSPVGQYNGNTWMNRTAGM